VNNEVTAWVAVAAFFAGVIVVVLLQASERLSQPQIRLSTGRIIPPQGGSGTAPPKIPFAEPVYDFPYAEEVR
jgi:hypothetical protein